MEQAHGGVYSQLATNLQEPLARLILLEMDVSDLTNEGVELTIITGAASLARNQVNDKIRLWIEDIAMAATLPEPALARLDWNAFMQITAAGRDLDFTKIMMSEQKFQQQQQAQQQQQMQTMGAEAAMKNADPNALAAAMSGQIQG